MSTLEIGNIILVFSLFLIGTIACSDNEVSNNNHIHKNNEINNNIDPENELNSTKEDEEVTITIRSYDIFGDEENFKKFYLDPLKEIHPHIHLETVEVSMDDMEDHILAGTAPDIYVGWNGDLPEIIDYELATDVFPYVEKYGSDLSRFIPEVIDSVTVDGKLYGMPYARQFNALYYNKDIFDLFGVDYPDDGLTWEEVAELSRHVSGERNNIDYIGFNTGPVWRLLGPLSLGSLIEYGTLKNLVRERREDFVTVFETLQQIYHVPGNYHEDVRDLASEAGLNNFAEGRLAMLAHVNRVSSFPDVNWGVAQYPSFPQAPDTYEAVDAHYYFLLSTSEHPEEAFKVMDLFSSYEAQRRFATEASRFPVLDDQDLMLEFAQENEFTKDIDFSGVLKSKPAEQSLLHVSMYETQAIFTEKVMEMMEEGKDVNTVVSELEQEIDILILEYEGSE